MKLAGFKFWIHQVNDLQKSVHPPTTPVFHHQSEKVRGHLKVIKGQSQSLVLSSGSTNIPHMLLHTVFFIACAKTLISKKREEQHIMESSQPQIEASFLCILPAWYVSSITPDKNKERLLLKYIFFNVYTYLQLIFLSHQQTVWII